MDCRGHVSAGRTVIGDGHLDGNLHKSVIDISVREVDGSTITTFNSEDSPPPIPSS
jgi:hypothetical protein